MSVPIIVMSGEQTVDPIAEYEKEASDNLELLTADLGPVFTNYLVNMAHKMGVKCSGKQQMNAKEWGKLIDGGVTRMQ